MLRTLKNILKIDGLQTEEVFVDGCGGEDGWDEERLKSLGCGLERLITIS